MEHRGNCTGSPPQLHVHTQSAAAPPAEPSGGNGSFYILIVMTFYGVFLCGILLGYLQSKRRERRRTNVFTRLVHEEQQREWGALPKKHSLSSPGPPAVHGVLPFCGCHGNTMGRLYCEGALACTLCAEQNSSSSLCAPADTRVTIEEEESDGSGEVARDESDDSR